MKLSPQFIFTVCCLINLFNFIDRGIIPGSTNEFNSFIMQTTKTTTPDVYLGLLQSSFIIGLVFGAFLFGHSVHHYERFLLTRIGCSVWLLAVFFSGISYYTNSYAFLFVCRMISGFGEASLQCTIPPWIQKYAGKEKKGQWLSIFYTAIPVGTALGYAYSSLMTKSFGWQFAFIGESIMIFPFVFILYFISEDSNNLIPLATEEEAESGASTDVAEDHKPENKPTVLEELKALCEQPIYLCIIFGCAAQTATLIGLSTFGSSFMMGLGYFQEEAQASSMFGILISIAGILGTPVGGFLLDYLLSRQLLQPPSSVPPGRKAPHESLTTSDKDALLHHQSSSGQEKALLEIIGCMSYWSNYLATLLFCLLYFIQDRSLYLTTITVACFLVFSSNTGLNIACMVSVPPQHQSFAIALQVLVGHLFGDVPSPVIAGWLKDSLAPGCVPSGSDGSSDTENYSASASCRADGEGLRMTMFLVSVWMYWCVVLYGWAWYLIKKAA